MELSNEFEVSVPMEQAWGILTTIERIAPCMPGAELREVKDDEYLGVVKVKVGPITAEYRGAARFLEKDDATHRAVLLAEGREARGQGNAKATITALLEPSGEHTRVTVTTDLQITGKVAQFGRGVLADVSSKLLGQFVQNLERTVIGAAGQPTASATSGPVTEPPPIGGAATSEPVDLLRLAGNPVSKRIVPLIGATLFILVFAKLVCRRRARRRMRRVVN